MHTHVVVYETLYACSNIVDAEDVLERCRKVFDIWVVKYWFGSLWYILNKNALGTALDKLRLSSRATENQFTFSISLQS
jgi:hypothetical protein